MPQALPANAVPNASGREQMALVHQVAGEGQQCLIGNRQPHDAEHQQRENREVAVLRDPAEDLLFHWYDAVRPARQTTTSVTSTGVRGPPTTTMPLSVT